MSFLWIVTRNKVHKFFYDVNHACVFVIKLQLHDTGLLSIRIWLKAELSEIYKNLKVFLSALSFEAGLKVPE